MKNKILKITVILFIVAFIFGFTKGHAVEVELTEKMEQLPTNSVLTATEKAREQQ